MRNGIIATVFIMLLGIILVTSFVISQIQYLNNIKNMEECEATVSKVSVDSNRYNVFNLKDVYVKYIVDGVEYEQNLSTNTGISFGKQLTNIKVGEKIGIYYNPKNPMNISSKATQKTGIFVAVFGFLTFIFGLTILIIIIKRNKQLRN